MVRGTPKPPTPSAVPKLPHPPAVLATPESADLVTLGPDALLWRIYRAGGDHPVGWEAFRHFGPVANGRFDHHPPPPSEQPDRGIYYASLEIQAAVAESFADTRTIDRLHDAPWLVAFRPVRAITLLDLSGAWPTRAGASQAISTGRREIAQEWSRSIWSAFPGVDGLLYPSAMAGGEVNVALYERASDAFPAHPALHLPLAHPGMLDDLNRIAIRYGYSLV